MKEPSVIAAAVVGSVKRFRPEVHVGAQTRTSLVRGCRQWFAWRCAG